MYKDAGRKEEHPSESIMLWAERHPGKEDPAPIQEHRCNSSSTMLDDRGTDTQKVDSSGSNSRYRRNTSLGFFATSSSQSSGFSSTVPCPACQYRCKEHAKYCEECGHPLKQLRREQQHQWSQYPYNAHDRKPNDYYKCQEWAWKEW